MSAVAGRRLRWALSDGLVLAGRELAHLRHQPGELVAALVFPAVMVVLFGYVFGSAIEVPGGGDYREYLMPGLFSMVTLSSLMAVTQKVAADAEKGVMDRFRAMPTARSALAFGHTGADLAGGLLALAIMMGAGAAAGWAPHRGAARAAGAVALIVLLRYALSWLGCWLGLAAPSEEVADRLGPLVLPVSMLSNAFVPTDGMPAWLRVAAEWSPVSALTAASRTLFGNAGVPAGPAPWPLAHPVLAVCLWSAVLLAVFVPLTARAYRRRGR
ncbi:ABC transporter permease [Actinomadura rayongensis]|uniref:Transport permease protein n=1 Tax=Actinomadura rayongensis TaxID=1429076 RepID=A0A6I4WJZ0_9ACTN|nr:ABC transporter permease [Actinomadura rayongensis]MXQ67264.1 ABC transporter permease [Actinomadura rayongensis]